MGNAVFTCNQNLLAPYYNSYEFSRVKRNSGP